MSQPFTPTPAYHVFLQKLVQTRLDRGFSTAELSEYLGLSTQQIEAYEAGAKPLGFIEVRTWLLALDMPFVVFAATLDDELDSTLLRDERVGQPSTQSTEQPIDTDSQENIL
ncbi:XRE family transcriptional regulator [bacterium]|nr:MAG: XRE family transcriptional regulator [bacterium]